METNTTNKNTSLKDTKRIIDSIFQYEDFRLFLQEYFNAKKVEMPSFSQRYFAKKAGFNAHNFCTLVLKGKRNLSVDSIQKISRAIGLKGKSASYFEYLVYLNQASSLEDKEFYFKKIQQIGKKTQFYQLHKDQFFFYEKWYYPVVRELLIMHDWKGDFAALAKAVRPPLTHQEARETVEMLEKTGIVQKNEHGRYLLTSKFMTSEGVPDFIRKKARRDVLYKGIVTIDTVEPSEKYAAYSTVAMSKKLYKEVRAILDDTRQRVLGLVDDDDEAPDEVYEVVFQVFPVSNLSRINAIELSGDGHVK